MPDVKEKTQVTIDKISIDKLWDKSLKKPITDAATKTLERALKGGKGLQPVGSIKAKDKGLGVTLTFNEVTHDGKKNTLTLKLSMLVSKYPGPRIATTAGSPAKMVANKMNEKAAVKNAPLLAGDLVDSQMPKLIKLVEALAKSL